MRGDMRRPFYIQLRSLMMKCTILFLVMCFVFITGCTTAPVAPTPLTDQPANTPEGYPLSVQSTPLATDYPPPEQVTSSPEPTWTPAAGLGIVTARILLNGNPVIDVRMYLADIIKNDEGQSISASVDPSASPQAYTDSNGVFTFINVKPGEYSLILNNALESYMIYKPNTQESFIIIVEPDAKVDLGELDYTDLPIKQ
jgi:hypothetical protein